MEDLTQKEGQLSIELDEKTADGVYSNLAVINHSPSEFVVDFINVMPGVPKARVRSRVILTPQHAKRLLGALAENIQRFEKSSRELLLSKSNNLPFRFLDCKERLNM
ncbi:hypothetical protein CCAN12_780061 [Capnocytophaga canimorsus]|uniref:DUF3467 domain-containing protein n=1 Tax=Capnocytophaga canimorsus TaxID=28188 RepID=A0A0B7HQX0_9FLAO|nr:hypothetical protein CCAN12_780061 [Capnocytophaga canimorsus]